MLSSTEFDTKEEVIAIAPETEQEAKLSQEISDIKQETPQISNAPTNSDDDITNATNMQRQYIAKSQVCDNVGTVAPVSLLYDMNKTLTDLNLKVNGVDNFVMAKLGYKSKIDLCLAFSAEQVDALALAIHQIEHNGNYIIEGDMTGVGKGRVAAGLMRYAALRGLKPIFCTEKANLFSDIFRDIIDIDFDSGIILSELMPEKKERVKRVSLKEIKERIKEDIDAGEFELDGYDAENLFDADNKQKLSDAIEEYRELYFPNDLVIESVYRDNNKYDFDILKPGVKRFVPFILNADDIKTKIKDKNGNIIYEAFTSAKGQQQKKKEILDSRELPEGYDCLMLTYSQINSAKAYEKREFVKAIARGNIVIFDESHNASGNSNTGKFLKEVVLETIGGCFLSATYAKRPENMALYALKTCLTDTELEPDKLVAAIETGGVPLQEIISSALASEGQMMRREKSYQGIKVTYNVFDESMIELGLPNFNLREKHEMISDKVTNIVRQIMLFQETHIKPIVQKIKDDQPQLTIGQTAGQGEATVNNPPIFSGVFNLINQLLFAIKAEAVAQRAILLMQEGKKPVIAFASTMESFLEYFPKEDGAEIPTDFGIVLKRRIEKVMTYRINYPNGESIRNAIEVDEMSPEGQFFYYEILKLIEDTAFGIKISPIDTIVQTIKDAGFAVGEVTGRNKYVQYLPNDRGLIKKRNIPAASDEFRKFNENEYDCLLINRSGSTGASAHSFVTEKVFEIKTENGVKVVPTSLEPRTEVKQRVMLILQPELDISTEVQKRGRINRTGQVFLPEYEYWSSAIPAEKRLMMMLQKKLKSLDANVSGNQDQSNSVLHVVDFLNQYGDEVVKEYLRENEEVDNLTGNVEGDNKDAKTASDNLAHKVSGRVAILSIDHQNKFYNDVSQKYSKLEQDLRSKDEWKLVVAYQKLNATVIKTDVVSVGNFDSKSVFGGPIIMETCWVDNLRKPYTLAEVQQMLISTLTWKSENPSESNQILTPAIFENKLIGELDIFMKAKKETELQNQQFWLQNELAKITNSKAYLKLTEEVQKAEFVSATTKAIESDLEKRKVAFLDRHNFNHSERIKIIQFCTPGRLVTVPTRVEDKEENIHGFLVGFYIDKDNWAPSKMSVKIVFPSQLKQINVDCSSAYFQAIAYQTRSDYFTREFSQSKSDKWCIGDDYTDGWDAKIKDSTALRIRKNIVTGNILKALGQNINGKLIKYSTSDGKVKRGILLANESSATSNGGVVDAAKVPVKVPINALYDKITTMKLGEKFAINDAAWLVRYRETFKLFLSTSSKSSNYIPVNSDKDLNSIVIDGKFEKKSGEWQAELEPKMLIYLTTLLWEKYKIYADVPRAYFETIKGSFDIEERGASELLDNKSILNEYNAELEKFAVEQEALEFKHQTEAQLLKKSQEEQQAYRMEQQYAQLRVARYLFSIFNKFLAFKKAEDKRKKQNQLHVNFK
jgi:hypothetical protein